MKKITPMEPMLKEKLVNNEDNIYQVKWDGIRILTYHDSKGFTVATRKGKDKTNTFPELKELKKISASFILDGEVVIIENGVNDFSKILTRNQMINKNNIELTSKKQPVSYMVFDILFLNGEWLNDFSFIQRHGILKDVLSDIKQTHINVCKNYSDGEKLFEATKTQKLEGIIEKVKDSKYVFKKSMSWKKYKHTIDIEAYVGGILVKDKVLSSLAIGVKDGTKLRYIGNVGIGINNQNTKEIISFATKNIENKNPFINQNIKNHIFLKPKLKVNIEFLQWTSQKTMRSPVLRGVIKELY
ncbi:hypothetical protein PRVXT_000016 [Proteinivorax tanatarense]|uniref:DNA ligase (ATP) n=1 Tax=Proteinivorax tanatarense TaxID=1260629 RepID=A0AAU7VMD0_9FIRM